MNCARVTVAALALVALGGCGRGSSGGAPAPLGRALGAVPPGATSAPAPVGDPPVERGGTVPAEQAARENAPSPGSGAPTPQAALRGYALAYTNWQAVSLAAHERRLASLGVGAARLAAEQTAASLGADSSLAADHVRNRGVVLSIASGEGSARGLWVVVTHEQTTGTGAYAGLPGSVHVTLGRVVEVPGAGWVVSEWRPSD